MERIDDPELRRAAAMDRALLMSKLFRKEYFEEITAAMNNTDRETSRSNFYLVAMEKAGLTETQTNWLWNYLKNYKKTLVWNNPPANGW